MKAAVGVAVVGGTAVVGVSAMAPSSDVAVVTKLVDGDTIDVEVGGADQRIRLLNVDTPETVDPDRDVQCLGPEAAAHLAALLPIGTEVALRFDDQRMDSYGRTLAAVFDGDVLINAEMARAGLGVAVTYDGNDRFLPPVEQAQAEAREAGRGLYSADVACTLPAKVRDAEVALAAAPASPATGTAADLEAAAVQADSSLNIGGLFLSWAAAPHRGLIWAAFDSERQRTVVAGVSVRAESVRSVQVANRTGAASTRQREKEADRIVEDRAAADREVRERVAAEGAATRTAEKAAAARAAAEKPVKTVRKPVKKPRPPVAGPSTPGGSGSSRDPYPGYTGPRCYLPGGKTYRPC